MDILSWIVTGAVVGFIGRIILPSRNPVGLIVSGLLGVAGALLGGLLSVNLGVAGTTGFNLGSLIIAVLGSITVLVSLGSLIFMVLDSMVSQQRAA